MPFPVSLSFHPPLGPLPSNVPKLFKDRPKGLWKGRVTHSPSIVPDRKELPKSPHPISDTDDDDPLRTPPPPSTDHHFRPRKRPRTHPDDHYSDISDDALHVQQTEEGEDEEEEEVYYWDYSRQRINILTIPATTCSAAKDTGWTTRTKKIDTSTTAKRGAWALMQAQADNNGMTCNLNDWEDLKDLFARAAEHYEGNDSAEALPLLRGVIHECHRFLVCYPDPSVLFVNQTSTASTSTDNITHSPKTPSNVGGYRRDRSRCTCFAELPTAFHALLGTALFLFGNIVAQESSLVLVGEPTDPVPYWLAALDVFETGENLPSRTGGGAGLAQLPEDWRMAIVWGRTLVCLTEELVNRQAEAVRLELDPSSVTLDIEEPKWPEESPFHAIAAQRQPVTRRMSFDTATPNDLLVLAMDQFSRGIFHMPHPQNRHSPSIPTAVPSSSSSSPSHPAATSPKAFMSPMSSFAAPSASVITTTSTILSGRGGCSSNGSTSCSSSSSATLPTSYTSCISSSSLFTLAGRNDDSFSRAKQLYTIAFEVLHVAEKLESTSERSYWASWADSVLSQMKMEAVPEDVWRTCILRSKGRCRLVVGSAYAEEIEASLERGELDFLETEEAEEARADLALAIELFERVRAKEQENDSEKERGKKETEKEKEKDPALEAAAGEEGKPGDDEEGHVPPETEGLGVLLAEAFVTLANLTRDQDEREVLYERAKAEAGWKMTLDLDDEDEDEDDDDDDDDNRMDESH